MRPDISLWWHTLARNPALAPFWELIEAAKEGRAPDPVAVKQIADASRVLFEDGEMDKLLSEFGKRLKLHTKQGKHKASTAGDAMHYMRHVGFLIQAEERLIASGMPHRQALAAAKLEISQREGISVRTLTRWRAERGEACAKALTQEKARLEAEFAPWVAKMEQYMRKMESHLMRYGSDEVREFFRVCAAKKHDDAARGSGS